MERSTDTAAAPAPHPAIRIGASRFARVLFYLLVLIGLALLYGRGDYSPTGFIYQAF
jgi:hypothetical protein